MQSKWLIIYKYHAETNECSFKFCHCIEELYEHYIDNCNCNNLFDLDNNIPCDRTIFDLYNLPHIKCLDCDFTTSHFVYKHDKVKLIDNFEEPKNIKDIAFFNIELCFVNGNKINYDVFDFENDRERNDLTMWFENNRDKYNKTTKFCI
jgi:hypothetical protein